MKRREITAFVTEVGQRALDAGPILDTPEARAMTAYALGGQVVTMLFTKWEHSSPNEKREAASAMCVFVVRGLLEKEPGATTGTVTHILSEGLALCGKGLPTDWPTDRWVYPFGADKATCVACVRAHERGKKG